MYTNYCSNSYILYITVTTLLKKNYGRLCKCLPEDYSKTLEKLKVIMSIPDHICQQIYNHKDTNNLIIYVLLSKVTSTHTMVKFFSTLESLVDDEALKQVVQNLRQGKLVCILVNIGVTNMST